jgi:copper chaperone CopZ
MKQLTFEVDGMSCGGCSTRVQRALQDLGVKATVTRDPGRAVVELDEAIDPATVQQAIVGAGYRARLMPPGG